MHQRNSKNIRLFVVEERSAEVLLPIITDNVKPLTTIMSDQWKAYERLDMHSFNHVSVNHSVSFVNPVTGTHTNGIEGSWSAVKAKMRQIGGVKRIHYQAHLMEFCWRRMHRNDEVTSMTVSLLGMLQISR